MTPWLMCEYELENSGKFNLKKKKKRFCQFLYFLSRKSSGFTCILGFEVPFYRLSKWDKQIVHYGEQIIFASVSIKTICNIKFLTFTYPKRDFYTTKSHITFPFFSCQAAYLSFINASNLSLFTFWCYMKITSKTCSSIAHEMQEMYIMSKLHHIIVQKFTSTSVLANKIKLPQKSTWNFNA